MGNGRRAYYIKVDCMDSNEKDTKQNSGRKIKRSAKQRNPNLRLVKNGDKPVKDESPSKGGKPSFGGKEAGETKKAASKAKKEEEGTEKAVQKGKKKPDEAKKVVRGGNKKREGAEKTGGNERKTVGETEKNPEGKSSQGEKKKAAEMKKTARKGRNKKGKHSSGKGKGPEEGKKAGEGDAKKTGEKAAPEGDAKKPGGKAGPERNAKKPGGKAKPEGESEKAGEKTKPEEGAKKPKEKTKPEGETKPGGKKENPEEEKKKTGKKRKKTGKKKGQAGKKPDKENTQKRKSLKPESRKKGKDVYRDKLELGEWFAQHKSLVIIGVTIAACCTLLTGIYYYITTAYEVTTVYVDGNVHYTNEEVMDMVMKGRYGKNSLYLAMKYKDKGVEGIPFVEKMDVNILTPNTIRISVYEKALAGYVEYLGRYMYFDRDGTVVESSAERTGGIPQVTGLRFDYVVVNEPLPVENDEIFKRILDITQLLNKYELMADKIFFDSSYDLTLFFDDVRVTLGSSSEIDQKIIRLKSILPELEGKRGTLQMENYTEDTKNITFHQE